MQMNCDTDISTDQTHRDTIRSVSYSRRIDSRGENGEEDAKRFVPLLTAARVTLRRTRPSPITVEIRRRNNEAPIDSSSSLQNKSCLITAIDNYLSSQESSARNRERRRERNRISRYAFAAAFRGTTRSDFTPVPAPVPQCE